MAMNEWIFILILLAIFFIGAILFPIFREIRNKKDIKRLQKIGKKIICKVTKQEHSTWFLLNGYSLMKIELTPTADNEKKYGIFKMKLLQGSIIDIIRYNVFLRKRYTNLLLNEKKNIGKEIDLWINPSNYKDFVVNHKDLEIRRIKLHL